MSQFLFYLNQGIHHITDIKGFDHMLFVIALCAIYKIDQWKKVLILVTAFTLGHSITLALTALDIIHIKSSWVEFLIPLTILITSISNTIHHDSSNRRTLRYYYLMPLFFGLIHGMGFSSFFKAMMMGVSDHILFPLFAFNLGIEIGQMLILLVYGMVLFCFTWLIKVKHHDWKLFISGAAAGLAVHLMISVLVG